MLTLVMILVWIVSEVRLFRCFGVNRDSGVPEPPMRDGIAHRLVDHLIEDPEQPCSEVT